MGKTSIKQVVFEGIDPLVLLNNPLRATRGMSTSVHSWLDLELGVFDSAGQVFDQLLKNENDIIKAFQYTNFIVYLFDYSSWAQNQKIILEDIHAISEIIKNNSYNAELVLFCHKFDLLLENLEEGKVEETKQKIMDELKFRCFFTSIKPNLIYTLYNTFHELLSSFSEESLNLKSILDDNLEELSLTMFFITNNYNNIVAQSITPDFKCKYINFTHNLISQMNHTLEEMNEEDKINHLILQTKNNTNVILNNLNLSEKGFKNLICISETLTSSTLIWTAGEISRELNKKIKYNR